MINYFQFATINILNAKELNFLLMFVLQVIQFSLRDYVQYWYYTLSDDESFLLEIRQTLQNAIIQFATR